MRRWDIITIALLAFWVLLGPMALAFDGCSAMGVACEGPCGMPSCAILGPTASIAPVPDSSDYTVSRSRLPLNSFAALEPPPKLSQSS